MKKIILTASVAILSMGLFAQVENVKNAKKKANSGEFAEAIKLIDAALIDPSTKNSVDAWYTKGLVYYKMFDYEDNKRFEIPPGTPDVNVMSEAAYKAYKAWLVTDSLDVLESTSNPKRKGKLEYRKDDANKLVSMKNYINIYWYMLYEKKDYAGAKTALQDYINMPSKPIFDGNNKIALPTDTTYTSAKEDLNSVMQILVKEQIANKDTAAFLATLNEGAALFPTESFFLMKRIEYQLNSGNEQEAIKNIDDAIVLSPNDFVLYYMRGFIYSQNKENRSKARADFQKTMDLNPNYAAAYSAYGSLILDDADAIYDKGAFAKTARETEEYTKQAVDIYKQAFPYFDKAIELGLKDDVVFRRLRNTYKKLKMPTEEAKMNALLGY
jgi:hypothetical protein